MYIYVYNVRTYINIDWGKQNNLFLLGDADSHQRCTGAHERFQTALCSAVPTAQYWYICITDRAVWSVAPIDRSLLRSLLQAHHLSGQLPRQFLSLIEEQTSFQVGGGPREQIAETTNQLAL